MTTEFDNLINETMVTRKLARKIARAKKKVFKRKGDRVRPPNTPGNLPTNTKSPSTVSGGDTDVAQASVSV